MAFRELPGGDRTQGIEGSFGDPFQALLAAGFNMSTPTQQAGAERPAMHDASVSELLQTMLSRERRNQALAAAQANLINPNMFHHPMLDARKGDLIAQFDLQRKVQLLQLQNAFGVPTGFQGDVGGEELFAAARGFLPNPQGISAADLFAAKMAKAKLSGLPGSAATASLGSNSNSLLAPSAFLPRKESPSTVDDGASLTPDNNARKGLRCGNFPQVLHQLLSDLELQPGGTAVASFLPHGKAFAIHKPKEFVKNVMQKYFRMSHFSSFQRQLNMYGFKRIVGGPDHGAYYHDDFIKDKHLLYSKMKPNKRKKGTKQRAVSEPDSSESAERDNESLDKEEEQDDANETDASSQEDL